MKPNLPWHRRADHGEIVYRLYISTYYDDDMYVCIFPDRSEFFIHNCVDGVMKRMQFPDGYLKLEEKKAYVELMLRLGEWDELLEEM